MQHFYEFNLYKMLRKHIELYFQFKIKASHRCSATNKMLYLVVTQFMYKGYEHLCKALYSSNIRKQVYTIRWVIVLMLQAGE